MKGNNILVIGGDGFVGTLFCSYLRASGSEATSFDIKQGDNKDARRQIFDFRPYDRVYVLAWDVGGSKYLYEHEAQLRQLDWNLALLTNLLPQLAASGVPFLFVSSQLAEETDTVYGVTKRLGEVWTQLVGGVNVRLWNVYGALEGMSQRSHVISDFVWQALETGEIRMMTTGQEMRQFIYKDDVYSALVSALDQNLTKGLYDVTSFEWVSIRLVADFIAAETGARVVPGERIGSTPITPIRGRVPGWLPKISLQEGLQRTVALARERLASGTAS
jgi:nucleoside-diphosphate-sugar epimerase